jgi:5-hydroxyisourate hydrolase
MNRSPITTHVLDTSRGEPASGVPVTLELKNKDRWVSLGRAITDADGRASGLLPPDHGLTIGTYRLTFDVGPRGGFYPEVAIAFTVADPDQHYHVPLLLSPFGYSTYRGS